MKNEGTSTGKRVVGAMKKNIPKFCIEWTRQQVQCRTGAKGAGQSKAMRFCDHGGVDGARRKAIAWVKERKAFCDHGGVDVD